MKAKRQKQSKPRGPEHWAQCFLEHAARETAWASQFSKECNYIGAHDALVRRGVWLHAALLAQEKRTEPLKNPSHD